MIVDISKNKRVYLEKLPMGDGSYVYNVTIIGDNSEDAATIPCNDEGTAADLFVQLSDDKKYLIDSTNEKCACGRFVAPGDHRCFTCRNEQHAAAEAACGVE